MVLAWLAETLDAPWSAPPGFCQPRRIPHLHLQAWVEASSAAHDDSDDSELDEWGSESLTTTPRSPMGPPLPGPSLAARGGAAAGRGGQLAPVTEVSREGRASTPSKGTRGLRSASEQDGSDSDSGSSSSGEGKERSLGEEPSASFGFGGNMAVAGANALLAAHGNGSQRPPSSLTDGGFLSAWDTSASASQTATLSSSAPAGGRGGGGHTSYTTSGTGNATGTSGDFTFDRSRPALGGASGTQPSRSRSQRAGPLRQTLFIQMEFWWAGWAGWLLRRMGGLVGCCHTLCCCMLWVHLKHVHLLRTRRLIPPAAPPTHLRSPRTLRDVLDSGELDEERRWCAVWGLVVVVMVSCCCCCNPMLLHSLACTHSMYARGLAAPEGAPGRQSTASQLLAISCMAAGGCSSVKLPDTMLNGCSVEPLQVYSAPNFGRSGPHPCPRHHPP